MNRKIFLITGGTSGIGFHTAQEIAKEKKTVIITGKNLIKGKKILNQIKNNASNDDIHYINGDLSSQEEILNIVKVIKKKFSKIDVLINNVGTAYLKRTESVDGIEKTFATNHLSYFLITGLLLPLLINSNKSRIVNVSSSIHKKCTHIDFNDIEMKNSYNVFDAYRQSKLCNILFTYFLSNKLKSRGITVNCLNPGSINTGFTYIDNRNSANSYINQTLIKIPRKIYNISKDMFKKKNLLKNSTNLLSSLEGAKTSIYLAMDDSLDGITGKYYHKKESLLSSETSYNYNNQKKLWNLSEKLTNFTYYV